MKLSIILPCYNEEENVLRIRDELLTVLRKVNMDFEVVCVDDGSKDKTYDELMKLAKQEKSIKVVQHVQNSGLGAAVRTGIKNAAGDLTITLDADFTFHPEQIPFLLERFNNGDVDFVIGSPKLAGFDKDIPFYRRFLSEGVNVLYTLVLGKKVTAVSPIFRVYKTKDLKEILPKLKSTGFDINAEILFWLIKNKKKFVEIPAVLTQRIYGESKINNIKEIKNHLRMLWNMLRWRISS